MDWIQGIGNQIIWLAAVIAAGGTIGALVRKPLKTILEKLAIIQDDTCNLICDRLNQAYDHWMKKEYCPKADKARLIEMHRSYTAQGRNHLIKSYVDDLIDLPEYPPDTKKG